MIELRFEDRDDYLAVHFSGPTELAQLKDTTNRIWTEGQTRGFTRVLCDLREMPTPSSESLRFEWGVHIAETWGSRFKAAFLVENEPPNKLVETAAVNRGANIRFIEGEVAAIAWLLDAPQSTE